MNSAGFLKRILALIYDSLLIAAIIIVASLLLVFIYGEYPKILRFFENWIDKTFSAWGKVKVINVVFDGNTITFDGMNYVLFRLIRKIKNYSIKST